MRSRPADNPCNLAKSPPRQIGILELHLLLFSNVLSRFVPCLKLFCNSYKCSCTNIQKNTCKVKRGHQLFAKNLSMPKKEHRKADSKEDLGGRLREFLALKFSTLTAASEAFGKVATYFTSYVNGHASPGRETLSWLAAQGLNLNWLLTGEGAMLSTEEKTEPHHPPAEHVAEPPGHYEGTGLPHLGKAMAGFPDSILNTAKNELLEVDSDRVSITIDTADGRHVIIIANRPKRN